MFTEISPLITDLAGLQFTEAEGGRTQTTIEICRDGEWKHPVYGEIRVTPELRESFARNFAADVRKAGELPIDYDHHDGPAAAWICALRNEGPSLYADVWLTPAGAERVRSGEYRKFSPEWHPNWIDPETGKEHGPTLFGGAFTNKPFFRALAPLRCSEAETDALQLTERLAAVEAENAALRMAEERRSVEGALSGLRFQEGRSVLAPASRSALLDAVMALPASHRQPIVDAVRRLQFVEHGERGFTPASEGSEVLLTAAEEQSLRDLALRNNLPADELRRQFVEVKRRRA